MLFLQCCFESRVRITSCNTHTVTVDFATTVPVRMPKLTLAIPILTAPAPCMTRRTRPVFWGPCILNFSSFSQSSLSPFAPLSCGLGPSLAHLPLLHPLEKFLVAEKRPLQRRVTLLGGRKGLFIRVRKASIRVKKSMGVVYLY